MILVTTNISEMIIVNRDKYVHLRMEGSILSIFYFSRVFYIFSIWFHISLKIMIKKKKIMFEKKN